jgi:hypothetical protein
VRVAVLLSRGSYAFGWGQFIAGLGAMNLKNAGKTDSCARCIGIWFDHAMPSQVVVSLTSDACGRWTIDYGVRAVDGARWTQNCVPFGTHIELKHVSTPDCGQIEMYSDPPLMS